MPHAYMGDVILNLVPPGGTGLLLTYGHGFSGLGYFDTIFDTSCPTVIGDGLDPFSDCYAPDEALSGLARTSSAGVWTIDAQDTAGGDTGKIDAWKLVLCVAP
jgi:subtilisin-like proprotein convertase family protein